MFHNLREKPCFWQIVEKFQWFFKTSWSHVPTYSGTHFLVECKVQFCICTIFARFVFKVLSYCLIIVLTVVFFNIFCGNPIYKTTKNCHFSNFLNHLLLSEKMHRGLLTSEDGESLNYKLQPFATCVNFGIGGLTPYS